MDGANDEREEINNVNFNQDNGCFIVSTSNGIRVFNTHEFQSTFFRGKYDTNLVYPTEINLDVFHAIDQDQQYLMKGHMDEILMRLILIFD